MQCGNTSVGIMQLLCTYLCVYVHKKTHMSMHDLTFHKTSLRRQEGETDGSRTGQGGEPSQESTL